MDESYEQQSLVGFNDEVVDAAKEVVKQKHRRPLQSERFKIHADLGDNTKYVDHTMQLMALQRPNMASIDEVQQRITEYFTLCKNNDMKPSIESLSLAFRTDRKTMWNWANGHESKYIPQEVRDMLKLAYTAINSMLADYMQNGKVNPIPAIFLMKNNMGYSDQTEIVVTPNRPLGDESSAEELQKRISDGVIVEMPDE